MSGLFEVAYFRPRIILEFGHGREVFLPVPTTENQHRIGLADAGIVENSENSILTRFKKSRNKVVSHLNVTVYNSITVQ